MQFFYSVAFQTIVPVQPSPQTNITAISGERVILPCPIQPGALLQQYSVRWMKGSTTIAEASNPHSIMIVILDTRLIEPPTHWSLILSPSMIQAQTMSVRSLSRIP